MGVIKAPNKLSTNKSTVYELERRRKKRGNELILLKARRNLTQGRTEARKKARASKEFSALSPTGQEELIQQYIEADEQKRFVSSRLSGCVYTNNIIEFEIRRIHPQSISLQMKNLNGTTVQRRKHS